MVCTYCGSKTQVTNSRHQKRSNSVWRRRRCNACNAIFSTNEHVDYEKTWVVQYIDPSDGADSRKSQRLAPFMRDKLFVSIYKSCQHRPTALKDAIGLTDTVLAIITKEIRGGWISPKDIAQAAHSVLKRFDQPAAISYQAFHSMHFA